MSRGRKDIDRFQRAVASADWPKALEAVDRLIADGSDVASLHYNRGLVLKNLSQRGEALAAFEKALDLDPRHDNARFECAAALFDRGRFEDAVHLFRGYLQVLPNDADAHLNLGVALSRLGRSDEALSSLREAHRLAGSSEAALALAAAERDGGCLDAMERLIGRLDHDDPKIAAAVLKVRTQGARGRLALKVDDG